MSRRGLYTIAPHGRFLPLLVDRVLDGTLLGGWDRSGPFWLSDVTIILPTRRSRLVLAELFAERLGGAALLPDIRTFGGESAEEEPFLPPSDAPALQLAMSGLERRLILSRLVGDFARRTEIFASPPNAAEILWLADSLGELIDDFAIEDVRPEALRELVPEEMGESWQQILKFLDIALDAWPQLLAARGMVDGAARRNEQLRRQAATAEQLYKERPVIAAGSTGSIPATSALLRAIVDLPRGALVLPGLDTGLDAEQHKRLIEGDANQGHPQYGLAKLLRGLGAGIADVEELAGTAARTQMARLALAPADETVAWPAQREAVEDALSGVGVIAAPTADLEARAIALATRQAVSDGRSVGIVVRDQTLARRIAVELERHGIAVDDPAGTPLYQSSAGRLARQMLAVVESAFAPLDVVALLRNGAVTLGRERDEVRRLGGILDLKLRSERPAQGLEGLIALAGERVELVEMLRALGAALQPLGDLLSRAEIDARRFVGALLATIEPLVGGVQLPGFIEFRAWGNAIASIDDTGAPFPPENLSAVLSALMAGEKVQSPVRRRDDVHIWGELEARLMNPDLMILAGLNEDIWPPAADPGPWLSRKMRIDIGLEPPERRQGQAAHDFEIALGNGEVMLAYALRIGTSPALPSRLVQRLDAFISADAAATLRERGATWLRQAAAIDDAGVARPAQRPAPSPPAAMRPKRISVTEVETLMRSPYDIYAKHTLRLRKLEPLGSEPSARERGTMIHNVFEKFVAAGLSFAAPDAAERMLAMAEDAFSSLDSIKERRAIWLKRFERAAQMFLEWERERHGGIASRMAEAKGEWVFPALDNFVLSGKADRIDMRTDGTLEILDFKTGGVPSPGDMKGFEAPQLLLEAAMARAGAFPNVPARDSSALTYIKIGLGPAAFVTTPFSLGKGVDLMEAVDEIARRTQGHIETFLIRDHLPMPARIRPRATSGRKPRPGDYDHLARTDEWTLTAGVDDP
ncbi:MAG: double-strand break repair protein AddB [Devosia sp.]